jgi:hypothetical protein
MRDPSSRPVPEIGDHDLAHLAIEIGEIGDERRRTRRSEPPLLVRATSPQTLAARIFSPQRAQRAQREIKEGELQGGSELV